VKACGAMCAVDQSTSGNDGFVRASDLHTAAHVFQQCVGVSLSDGVGQDGERYRKHAEGEALNEVQCKSAVPWTNVAAMQRSAECQAAHSRARRITAKRV